MQRLSATLLWLLAAVLLGLGWNLKDPHLLRVRAFELPLLLVLISGGVAIAWRHRRRVLLAAFLIVAAVAVTREVAFRHHRHEVLNMPASMAAQLGGHFIIGYSSIEEVRPLVEKGLIGGIFVSQRNAEGKSYEALAREIADLQSIRRSAGLAPLIVATDQEGGAVSRLSPPLEKLPPLATLAHGDDIERKAEAYGERQGKALAKLGITVNLSPVVDLRTPRGAQPLDFNSHISERAISADPRVTAIVAAAYVRGLEESHVEATLKHFPGFGGVTADTHHFSAVLATPVADLRLRDWQPFRHVLQHSSAWLMLGHVIVPELDKKRPVSLSRAVVQRVIRGEWHYTGVLITDDLTMAAAYRHGLCEATVDAFNAGVDLLLISYDYEKFYDAMYCAAKAATAIDHSPSERQTFPRARETR